MKTHQYIILITLALGGLVACHDNGDIFVAESITGSVVIKDDYLELDERVAALATVKLKLNNTTTFLYEVKTDANGAFIFRHSSKSKTYSVTGETSETDASKTNILYSDSVSVVNNRSILKLRPQYKNGIKVKVSRGNEPLNAANVYLFVNKTQADSAKKVMTITNHTATVSTNAKGIAFFSNLQDTDYYVFIRATLPKKDTILTKRRPSLGKDILKDAVIVNLN
jgi:hypothetical protein